MRGRRFVGITIVSVVAFAVAFQRQLLADRIQQRHSLLLSLQLSDDTQKSKTIRVIRTAARKYSGEASMPSSRDYTTRKDESPQIKVSKTGVDGDYNHYRTVALKNTPDRALSLLTNDVLEAVKVAYPRVQPGDLGENVMLDGISFWELGRGQRYEFTNRVVIEITEPMIPCANLCKLPYINDDQLEAKHRIQKCQSFLEALDRAPGFRGWYAKVVQPGEILVGDEVVEVDSEL